jgi:hypothetical protein
MSRIDNSMRCLPWPPAAPFKSLFAVWLAIHDQRPSRRRGHYSWARANVELAGLIRALVTAPDC